MPGDFNRGHRFNAFTASNGVSDAEEWSKDRSGLICPSNAPSTLSNTTPREAIPPSFRLSLALELILILILNALVTRNRIRQKDHERDIDCRPRAPALC